MIKLGTRNIGRASALLFGIAAVTAACGDNGVTPPDAAPDAPPAPAVLAMTPMTNSFGSVTVGATSAAASFTVSNTGGSTSGTITPILTGTGAGEFAFQNGCSTLAPGGTCTITASFKPTAAGGKTAALVVSGSPGGSVMANLDGSGVALGSLTLAPGSASFGTQTVGVAVTTNDKTFTVTNGGGTASGSLTVTAAGSDPGEFTKTADTCSGQMIAAAATCSITVRFAPLSSGSKTASFVIVGNPGGTLNAAVSGNAVVAAALSVTPSVQDFGTVVVGGNTPIVFTVTNTGGVTSGAIANTLSGADAASFSIANSSCTGATLTPGNSCNITVRLNGGTAGAKNAQLDVTGTPGGNDSSLLSGLVVAPGSIVQSGNLAFGPITVGQNSGAQTITITNTGGSATGALTTALGGVNAADFNVVGGGNACQGATLAPMGSAGNACTISVRFSPQTAGNGKAATMTVTGAPGGTAITALSGDGIIAAQLSFNPGSKDFGSVTNGTQSATQTFTVTNIGGQTSGAVTPALGGANAGEFSIMNTTCAAALAPAAACDVLVFFKPTASGAKVATLTVTGASAALTGAGISPSQITANPTSLTFAGNTLVGTSSLVQSFTVTNNGSTTTGTIAVTITGANAGDYTQTNTCTTLIANATCQVTVTFTPTAAGARVATVNVTEGANSVGVAVSGTGQRKLEILVPNINPFDFGSVAIVGFGPCRQLTVRNNTASSVNLTVALSTNFTTPQDFDVCGNFFNADPFCTTGLVLLAGEQCTMGVDASPDMPGPITGFVKFSIGASVAAVDSSQEDYLAVGQTNSLVITPCTGGNCTAAPTPSFDFMNVNVGSSATQVFTLLNQTMATTGTLETQVSSPAQLFHIVQDNCAGTTLAVNATCTVTVLFQPTLGGAATAQLLIRDITTLPASQAARNLDGNGIIPATLFGAPTTAGFFDFGTVYIGEQSIPAAGAVFAITNTGNVNSGPITAGITGNVAFTIQTGASGDCVNGVTIVGPTAGPNVVTTCNVRVRFAPTVVHANTQQLLASLTVTGTPGGTTGQTNNLRGTSSSTIGLISLGALNYGNVIIGQVHDELFRMTNNSNQAVSFLSGTLSVGEFTVVNTVANPLSNCANLGAGAACDFTVRFAPTGSPGVTRGPVTLTMNATNGTATLGSIFGTAQSVANLVLTPATADFGSVLSGSASSALNFTLTNTGFQTATGIALSIPNANGNYSQINGCGATLAQNATCAVTVTFAPPLANTGTLTATLTVGSTLGGAPTAALTGSGISNGAVTVAPALANFGSAALTEQSARQVFVLANTNAGAAAALSLTPPANFVVDNTGVAAPLCTASLAPAATCNIGVRFAPATAGVKTAQFAFTAGSYAAVQGIGISNPNIGGLADNDFGTVTVNSFRARSYIVTNGNVGATGPLSFSITGATPTQFGIGSDTCTGVSLAAGGSCSFVAFFAPQVLNGFGPKSAIITLLSNAVGAGGVPANSGIAVPFAVSGVGANTADISITPGPAAQAEGNRAVGQQDAAATVFTISNASGSAATGPIFWNISDTTNFVTTTTGLTNPCINGSTTLTATSACQIAILYHPTTVGAHMTTLNASEFDGVTVDNVTGSVTGTGTQQLTGPTTPVALTANSNTTLTYTNNASIPTTPVEVLQDLLGTQVSIITDSCVAQILPAGGNCTIVVRYIPDGLNGPTNALLGVRSRVNLTSPPYGASGLTAFSVVGTTFTP